MPISAGCCAMAPSGWAAVLRQLNATERPDDQTWSPLEYACHVRDVHRLFDERLALMLEEDGPTFANWDQDETAVAERYDLSGPGRRGGELAAAAESIAQRYDALVGAPEETWARRGLRDNGTEFTVDSLRATTCMTSCTTATTSRHSRPVPR